MATGVLGRDWGRGSWTTGTPPSGLNEQIRVRIRGPLGEIDLLSKVPFKKAISRVKQGALLRGLPNTRS